MMNITEFLYQCFHFQVDGVKCVTSRVKSVIILIKYYYQFIISDFLVIR